MKGTNKPDKMNFAGLYHDLDEISGYLDYIQAKSNDSDSYDTLKQMKQKLQQTQKQIITTIAKEVIDDYRPNEKVEIRNDISLLEAVALIKEIEKKSMLMGISVVTAVYSGSAQPIAVHCMDHAYIASFDVANNKAYTSVALKMATSVLKNLSQPGQELYGIQHTNQGKIVIFGGGEPLLYKGKLVGGIGVSGGTEYEDTLLAEYGKNILEEVMMW